MGYSNVVQCRKITAVKIGFFLLCELLLTAVMDGEENEAALLVLETERVERLTMSAAKHVVDVDGQDDMRAQFDAETSADNKNYSSECLITENSQNAIDGLTLVDGADSNPDSVESGFSMVKSIAEVSSQSIANESESANVGCIESTTEQAAHTDSIMSSSVEAAEYTVQTLDLQFADNTGDDMTSFETVSRDMSDILHDESLLHSGKDSAEVGDVYDSVVNTNSPTAVLSEAELCDTQLTELVESATADGSENCTKGKHISNCSY